MMPYPKSALFFYFFISVIVAFSQPGPAGNILLSTSSAVAAPGDTVCVDVFGANIGEVEGMQFSLHWDTAVFHFVRVDNFSLPEMAESDFGLNFIDGGDLSFLYLLPQGQTLPANSRLFSLCLAAVGDVGEYSQVAFSTFPTPIELAGDIDGVTTVFPNYSVANGQLRITTDGSGDPLSLRVLDNTLANCANGAPARIAVEAAGGTAPYSYDWRSADNTLVSDADTLETDVPGAYRLVVTDADATVLSSVFNMITSDLLLNAPAVAAASCPEGNDGRIELDVTAGIGQYVFQWSNGADSAVVEGLIPGDYTVTVTDQAGCALSQQVTVGAGVSDLDVSNVIIVEASCATGTDGSIAPTLTGGSGAYAFLWSNGETTATVTGLSPGDYSLTVTDAVGCNIERQYTVGARESDLEVQDTLITDASCAQGTDGSIALTVLGGFGNYTFSWSNGADTEMVTGLSPGDYSVTVNDAVGCSIEEQYTVGAGTSDLQISDALIGDASCPTSADGSIALTVTGGAGGYAYQWSNAAATAAITGLTPGDYAVTVTDDAGCSVEATYSVGAGSGFDFQADVNPPICGASNGSIRLVLPQADDAYTFNWSNGPTTRDISGIGPGIYSVTVTETAGGCTSTQSFDLSWEPLAAVAAPQCLFTTSGTVQSFAGATITGGTGPYIFSWSTGVIDTAEAESLLPVPGAGAYTVTITDAGNCQVILIVEVPNCGRDNEPALTLTLQPAVVTAGDLICMDLQVDGFNDVKDLRFSIQWNSLQLEFVDALAVSIGGSDYRLIPGTGDGTVAFDLADGLDPVTIADGNTLVQLCFRAVGMPGTAMVRFGDSPRQRLAYNDQGQVFGLRTVDAGITINARPGTAGIAIGSAADVFPGEPVCIPVTIDSFSNVDSMRFRLTWDADLLQFDSVAAFNFPFLTNSNFNTANVAAGRLGFNWGSGGAEGVTQVEEAAIFNLCFTALDTIGSSEVTFASAPGTVELFSEGQLLPVRLFGGVVEITEFVWPGDANLSGTVNHFDLLPLGLAYGQQGPPRTPAILEWSAQRGSDWGGAVPGTDTDYKHADTGGDGTVGAADTMAIVRNWGQSIPGGGEGGFSAPDDDSPVLFVEPAVVGTGRTVAFNIALGEPGNAAEDVYGLAFSIVYDSLAIDATTVRVDFTGSWLGAYPGSLLGLAGNDAAAHRIDLALTRIDQRERSGTGVIARLLALTSDTIPGGGAGYELPFRIENVRLIDAAGQVKPVQPLATAATLEIASSTNDPTVARRIRVFPNPASTLVRLDAEGLDIERVDLLLPDGRSAGNWAAPATLDVGHLPGGTYWLRIITREGIAVKPLVIVR